MHKLVIYISDDRVKGSIIDTIHAAKHHISSEFGWDKDSFKVSYEMFDDGVVYYNCYIPTTVSVNDATQMLTGLGYIFNA